MIPTDPPELAEHLRNLDDVKRWAVADELVGLVGRKTADQVLTEAHHIFKEKS